MSKILLINIDWNHRSVYTAFIASTLLREKPNAKFTLITSMGSTVLDSTGFFENTHYLDIEKFIEESKTFSNETSEKEIKRFLAPVINTEWDTIVNLSSNLLGSILTHFLRAKEILGAHIYQDYAVLEHNCFASYLLTSLPDDHTNYFHFTYLFENIIKRHEKNIPIVTIWDKDKPGELTKRFDELKQKSGKTEIILIDTGMKRTGTLNNFNFLIYLFETILEENKYLPVLFSSNTHDDSFLINRLRELSDGEVFIVSSENPTQLNLFQNVSLIITDNFYLKAIADLSLKPSILIFTGPTLPVSDFSVNEKSCLLLTNELNSELAPVVADLYRYILSNVPVQLADNVEVYQTHIYKHLPIMLSLNGGKSQWKSDEDFARWWLGLRFLATLENFRVPAIDLNVAAYKSVIESERKHIKESFNHFLALFKQEQEKGVTEAKFQALESEDGVLSLGVKSIRFANRKQKNIDSKKSLEQLKNLLKEMLDFLAKEEEIK